MGDLLDFNFGTGQEQRTKTVRPSDRTEGKRLDKAGALASLGQVSK